MTPNAHRAGEMSDDARWHRGQSLWCALLSYDAGPERRELLGQYAKAHLEIAQDLESIGERRP